MATIWITCYLSLIVSGLLIARKKIRTARYLGIMDARKSAQRRERRASLARSFRLTNRSA